MKILKTDLRILMVSVAFSLLAIFAFPIQAHADIGANQQVQLEAQLENRIRSIVEKVDRHAIVQVHVVIKKVASQLPGVWAPEAVVTPLASDGSVASDGIDRIDVRVISQIDEIPGWIKDEIKKALVFNGVRADARYEKAKGTLESGDQSEPITTAIKDFGKELTQGLSSMGPGKAGKDVTLALWGIVGGLITAVLLIAGAVFSLGKRIETAFFRVVDEKLAPLMQTAVTSGGRRAESSSREMSNGSANAALPRPLSSDGGAFAEVSDDSIYALVVDCYWTESDGYAHYIWTELNMKQREALLSHSEFGKELFRYFTFVRQFPTESLDYHLDVRYVDASPLFAKINQADLAAYVRNHPTHASLVTPLRWDQLPISLADRLQTTVAMNSTVEVKPLAAVVLKASPLRELPRRLEVKTLTEADEKFLWENPSVVPANLRGGLKTLVWLALSPLEVREKVLGDIDARDLSEAWVGPAEVLLKLQEAVSPKKFEMVQFFAKEATTDRDGVIFAHLVSQGAQALNEVDAAASDATPAKEQAAAS